MSYTVFLVEDEIVTRESMRDNVPWEDAGFSLVGEASDGEAALPLICELRPDIVVTDVRMPFMDGLELARALKRLAPSTKVLFVSGHEEFALAKEALALSAVDYLLKPLSPPDLLDALRRTASAIEEENGTRAKLDLLERTSIEGKRAITERFLHDLASGRIAVPEAVATAAEFGLDIVARYYCAAVVAIERKDDAARTGYAEDLRAERIAREFLESCGYAHTFRRGLSEFVAIFRGDDAQQLDAGCVASLDSLRVDVERRSSSTVSAGIGSVKDRLQGIARSIDEADAARSYTYLFGRGRILLLRDAERLAGGRGIGSGFAPVAMARCLREGTAGEAVAAAVTLADSVGTPGTRGFIRDYAIADLVISAVRLVEELGGDPESTLPSLRDAEEASRSGDQGRLRDFLVEVAEKAIAFREAKRSDKYGDLIRKAKRAISERLSDPDLSLASAAEMACMSSSHFSAIFSKETGNTFSEALSRARIDKAKLLLRTTSLRSSEIATAVGFRDPHYFSYAFKKKEGLTPQEFRSAGGAKG